MSDDEVRDDDSDKDLKPFALDILIDRIYSEELLRIFYYQIKKYLTIAPRKFYSAAPQETDSFPIKKLINTGKRYGLDHPVQIHEISAIIDKAKHEFVINYLFMKQTTLEAISVFYALKDKWEENIIDDIREIIGFEQLFDQKWHITITKCKMNMHGAGTNVSVYVTIGFNLIYVADVLPQGTEYKRAKKEYDERKGSNMNRF